MDEDDDEEEDYGYGGLFEEDSGEDTDNSDADELDEVDDELGPEDGEGAENEIEVLGYSNLQATIVDHHRFLDIANSQVP